MSCVSDSAGWEGPYLCHSLAEFAADLLLIYVEKSNAVLVFVILLRTPICFVLICLLGKRINTFLFYKPKVSYSAFFFSSSVSSRITDLSCVVILRLKNA